MKKINSLSTLCLLLLLGITSVVHGHNPARQSPLWSPFGGHDGSNWQASDGYKNDDWFFGCHWSGQRVSFANGQMTLSLQHNGARSEEHTSELPSRGPLVCRLLLETKNVEPAL